MRVNWDISLPLKGENNYKKLFSKYFLFSAYREAKKRLETAVAMWSDLGICLNYIELDKIEDAKTCVDKLYKDYEMYPEFIAVRKALY